MKKAFRRFCRRFEKAYVSYHTWRFSGRVHESIGTLPIYNWWKVHEDLDFSYLLFRPVKKFSAAQLTALSGIWEKIYDEYIRHFGFSEEFLSIIQKKKNIASLKLQFIETEDATLRTFIEVEEFELKQMQEAASGKTDFYESKALMERMLHYPIDEHKMSVLSFFKTIRTLQKHPAKA